MATDGGGASSRGRVEATLLGPSYATTLAAAGHSWSADEPEEVGGGDTAPTPYELLLGALGACKTMTLKMYAERKGWSLTGVRVVLAHSRIHAKDCEECESPGGKIDRVEVEVELEGDLDEAQRSRLLEISERCPVHRTLTTETSIRSRLLGTDDEAS